VKEDSLQSESFSLHVRLRALNTTEYYDLVSSLLFKKPELNQLVLEWFKEKNRKSYWTAAKYLQKVKSIYYDILKDEAGWIKRFSDLKSEFKKRPAFLDEVNDL
jgi:hypothetical protein